MLVLLGCCVLKRWLYPEQAAVLHFPAVMHVTLVLCGSAYAFALLLLNGRTLPQQALTASMLKSKFCSLTV